MEVARAWLEGQGSKLPIEIENLLQIHSAFGPVTSWDAEPEAKLRFDEFSGEPRNADLVVYAIDMLGSYVLTVEAKADEPYGESVADALAAALERRIENPRSNGIARIERLAGSLFKVRNKGEPKVHELRYQLLTACAGTLAEAARKGTSRAVMLIHEFITTATEDANHQRNAKDLAAFVSRLSGSPLEAVVDGKLYGPFQCPASQGIQLFIGKVSRNLRPGNALPK